jgi:hypothetical protein
MEVRIMENLEKVQGKRRTLLGGKKKMGLPQQKPKEQFKGEGVIDFLTSEMSISPTMLAALLEVTERTLDNWKRSSFDELKEKNKSQRLIALYDFVNKAKKKGVEKKLLLNLLREPLSHEGGEEGPSALYFIVNEPTGQFFSGVGSTLLIDQFLK